MLWNLWAPMIQQSEDCLYRIYKGNKPGVERYMLRRNMGDGVWETIAVAPTAEELKESVEESA